MDLTQYTDINLIHDAKSLHESIYVSDCFGTKDLVFYELLLKELEDRGYRIREKKSLKIGR